MASVLPSTVPMKELAGEENKRLRRRLILYTVPGL